MFVFRSENQPDGENKVDGKIEDDEWFNDKNDNGEANQKLTAKEPLVSANKVGNTIEDNERTNKNRKKVHQSRDGGSKVKSKIDHNERSIGNNNEKGKENQEPPKQETFGTVDLFKGYDKKMTIVFHSVLAPHFKYDKSRGDRISMRFGGVPFGGFQKDLVELQPIRCVVCKFSSIDEVVLGS